jgi:hypothetical protein
MWFHHVLSEMDIMILSIRNMCLPEGNMIKAMEKRLEFPGGSPVVANCSVLGHWRLGRQLR